MLLSFAFEFARSSAWFTVEQWVGLLALFSRPVRPAQSSSLNRTPCREAQAADGSAPSWPSFPFPATTLLQGGRGGGHDRERRGTGREFGILGIEIWGLVSGCS